MMRATSSRAGDAALSDRRWKLRMIELKLLREEVVSVEEIQWLHDELAGVEPEDVDAEEEQAAIRRSLGDLRVCGLAACESLRGLVAGYSPTDQNYSVIHDILAELEEACKR